MYLKGRVTPLFSENALHTIEQQMVCTIALRFGSMVNIHFRWRDLSYWRVHICCPRIGFCFLCDAVSCSCRCRSPVQNLGQRLTLNPRVWVLYVASLLHVRFLVIDFNNTRIKASCLVMSRWLSGFTRETRWQGCKLCLLENHDKMRSQVSLLDETCPCCTSAVSRGCSERGLEFLLRAQN